MLYRNIVSVLLCSALTTPAYAHKKATLSPGQYSIGDIQQICLKAGNTWYGTTFNFAGNWINNPPNVSFVIGAVYGNYRVAGGSGQGYGNTAISVSRLPRNRNLLTADWYDWFDDLSYQNYVTDLIVERVKDSCDPPFTDQNTQAATQ